MFYNYSRSTRAALKLRDLPKNSRSINQNEFQKDRLLNYQKREKLKNLLMTKFINKYNIKEPKEIIEPIISQFVQNEKLTDEDLKQLNIKIKRLLKNRAMINMLKPKLTSNLSSLDISSPNIRRKKNEENKKLKSSNTIDFEKKIINQKASRGFPTITHKNNIKKRKASIPNNNKNRANISCDYKNNYINYFKNQVEELVKLEKELENNETKNRSYKRIDFSRDGDEWNAIMKYKTKEFEKKLFEDRLKEKEIQKRNREYLDFQIKEKQKKMMEEELQEKEYNKIIQEHSKKLDEIEAEKAQKKKEKQKKFHESAFILLQLDKIRRRIDVLKEKKYDSILAENYKKMLEKDKKEEIANKKRKNDELKKALKEHEMNQLLLKEKKKKEKEEDCKRIEEITKMEQRQDNIKWDIYKRVEKLGNKYDMSQGEIIREKLKKQEKEDEDVFANYYEAKIKNDNKNYVKDLLKKRKEMQDLRTFLQIQIEEKQKEESFLKKLDKEQGRIFKIDSKRYIEEEQDKRKKMKMMNRKNLEGILNQIEEKKRSRSKSSIMNDNEYAINRELLEKANEEEEKTK